MYHVDLGMRHESVTIQYDLRTCTRVDEQLHNFVTVEFGSIVHGCVAV